MRKYDITILPLQAERIALEASKTGTAVGLSQSGSTLIIFTGKEVFTINAEGKDTEPIKQC